jgi:hypothetical protein
VKKYTYYWEIQTILEQFVGAFNDVFVKRYDKDKNLVGSSNGIKVNYVYGPKQRVFNTLQNPAPGGITVPAIAVSLGTISRDQTRVFNKNDGFNVNYSKFNESIDFVKHIPQPIPINIGVNMTLITKYQNDMEQLISNFAPYCDPYIVISWKTPELDNSLIPYEIRTEVLWNGNINLQYPNDAGPSQAFRIVADTSFTIKGWLFKKIDEIVKKIYVINSDYTAINSDSNILIDLDEYQTDYLSISARPQLRDIQPCEIVAFSPFNNFKTIEIYGKSFFEVRNVYLSASDESMFDNITLYNPFSSILNMENKYPAFRGIVVPEFTLYNENYLTFDLPQNPKVSGNIDIIVENEAGYGILTRDKERPKVFAYDGALGLECEDCGMDGLSIK